MKKRLNVRQKGHNLERRLVKVFQELGWVDSCSSRSESKRTDDLGIDLCYTAPFHIQCKAVENLGSSHSVLVSMPKIKEKYNLVFHKKNNQGTVVSMMEEDFLSLLEQMIDKNIIVPKGFLE